MKFVKCNNIKDGMVLARDLHLFDQETNKVLLLRKGAKINNAYIKRLREIGIAGCYIKDGVADEMDIHTVMKDEEKTKAILEVKEIFDSALSNTTEVTKEEMGKMEDISQSLVKTITSEEFIRVSVGDLKNYDDYTYHHSLAVAVLAIAIGKELGLTSFELRELGIASLLHDIGKLQVPKEIMEKPTNLTEAEFRQVKLHPTMGAEYLRKQGLIDRDIYDGIVSHHEHFDGTGYPLGLKGKDIPLFGRIIAIADVYDATTSNRPYRAPVQPTDAFEYLMGNSGRHFDPDILDIFMRKIEPYPVGSCVMLSNHKPGIVINTFDELPLRPVVRGLDDHKIYDLQEDFSLNNVTILGFYADLEVQEVRA